MPDGTNDRPIPLDPAPRRSSAPPDAIVQQTRASLRAAEVYVRLLTNRLDLAVARELVTLEGVDAAVLARVTAAGSRLRDLADRALVCIDPDVAATARAVADLAEEMADGSVSG